MQVDNIEDSFSIIKSKPKPLAAYLFTNNEQLKKDYVENISSGGMLINDTILHVVILFLKFIHRKINPISAIFYYVPMFINPLFSNTAASIGGKGEIMLSLSGGWLI